MKPKFITIVLAVLLFAFIAPFAGGADKFPSPSGAVNDFAGIIPQQYKNSIEMLANEVLQKTGTSIVVVTMKDIDGADPSDYANRLYEAWGIGKKGEDKGVLVLLALEERRIRIEVGYGVEGILPDGLTGEILDRYAVPYLKKGNYGAGLFNAAAAVSAVVAKDAGVSLTGVPNVRTVNKGEKSGGGLFPLLMIAAVLCLLLGTRQGRAMLPFIILMLLAGGGGRGGSGFGGFSGGFGGFGGGMSGGGGAGRGF